MSRNEDLLLNEYKKYDYLNSDKENPLIKILVSYIKPSYLFKSKILTPMHLGRSVATEVSKDGEVSEDDLKWLYDNCIGDDDFDGSISNVNRRVGFLTGTYWAWQNYEKLGNPEYFGSFGYRRLFVPYLLDDLTSYDAIIPEPEYLSEGSIRKQFIKAHGATLCNITVETLKKIHPEDIENFNSYINQPWAYLRELYILKKELFFDFCNWIFPLLFELLSISDNCFALSEQEKSALLKRRHDTPQEFDLYMKRDIAFIVERLTGFYLYKLKQNPSYHICEQPIIMIDEHVEVSAYEQQITIAKLKRYIDELNKKYLLPNLTKSNEKICMISVVNDYHMYDKYVRNNPFVKNQNNIECFDYDNRNENLPISVRYNQFLNSYDFSKPAWFVFCHTDWEIQDDINLKLTYLSKDCIYGAAGSYIVNLPDKIFKQNTGSFMETTRDNNSVRISIQDEEVCRVDSLDSMVMIVHSSLVEKFNLRFDENLYWDLYVEDFCLNAFKNHNIQAYTFNFENTHHSDAGFKALPVSYYKSLNYLKNKYPEDIYAGTCSYIGGKKQLIAGYKEAMLYKMRSKIKQAIKK